MNGIQLSSDIVAGMKAGIADSTDMITDTINNAALAEIAVMFIGLACGIGIALYFIKGHRSDGDSLASLSSNGVTDAYYASKYLDSGGDIKNASNQDFVRNWAKNAKI
jgi:hypothetical protein